MYSYFCFFIYFCPQCFLFLRSSCQSVHVWLHLCLEIWSSAGFLISPLTATSVKASWLSDRFSVFGRPPFIPLVLTLLVKFFLQKRLPLLLTYFHLQGWAHFHATSQAVCSWNTPCGCQVTYVWLRVWNRKSHLWDFICDAAHLWLWNEVIPVTQMHTSKPINVKCKTLLKSHHRNYFQLEFHL